MKRAMETMLATLAVVVTAPMWADSVPNDRQSWQNPLILEGFEVAIPAGSTESAYPGAPVERTGQSTCFSADGDSIPCRGTGQDGELRPGIVWPEPRFAHLGDGTVIDNLTGLNWLRDGGCLGDADWEQALVKVQTLNSGTDFSCTDYAAGTWDDWRLPNIKEWVSLVDYSSFNPVLPTGHPFVGVGSIYWSSTTDLETPSRALIDDLFNGALLSQAKSETHRAWAVRGTPHVDYPDAVERTGQTTCHDASGAVVGCAGTGQDGELQSGVEWPSPRFIDRGDGTVSDELSGSVWLKDTACLGDPPWDDALLAVQQLGQGVDFNCADYMPSVRLGWRMPTIREVVSLLDFGQKDPAFPSGNPFVGQTSVTYWTSSNYLAPNGADLAYSVNAAVGTSDLMSKTGAFRAWAVRGGLALSGNSGLDATFGTGGKVTTDFDDNSGDSALDAVLQSDGKIVVVGSSTDSTTFADGFALARYESDGSLDATFGTGGKVFTDLGADESELPWDATLQPDGKILLTGFYADWAAGKRAFPLLRYNTDGSLDATFGSGGVVISEIGPGATAFGVALQGDGKIIVSGRVGTTEIDFALARYDSSGVLDPTFGSGGVVTTDIGGAFDSTSGAPVILPGGKLLVVGTTGPSSSGPRDIAVARYTSDGSLDPTFGTGGIAISEFMTGADDRLGGGPAVRSDGRFLVAGYVDNGFDNDMAVAQFESDGSADVTFGSGGVSIVDLGSEDLAQGEPVLDATGNLLISGFSGFFSNSFQPGFFALLRLDSEGAIDPTFWGDGLVTLEFGGTTPDIGRQSLLQEDGRVLIIGGASFETDSDFAMARLLEAPIFADGFETGDASSWSKSTP